MEASQVISPIVVLCTASVSTYLVLRQLRHNARALIASTALQLESQFLASFRETCHAIERGEFDHLTISSTPTEKLVTFEEYLDFFNTIGVLVKLESISEEAVFEIYPYRLSRLRSLSLTRELLTSQPEAWRGIQFLFDMSEANAEYQSLSARRRRDLREQAMRKQQGAKP